MLEPRQAKILGAAIEEYIRTGEPVSSRAILDHSDLSCSSATVRAELVVLERDGYLAQPHTSAGRVPTDRGYRYYIDHLSAGSLREPVQSRIEHFFASMHLELNRMLKQTSGLLAEVTHYPAVVLGPGLRGQTARDVHLLPVGPGEVLLVLVTERGRVTQSLLRFDQPVDPSEAARAEEVLAAALDGVELGGGPGGTPDLGDADLPPAAAELAGRALGAVLEAATSDREVFLGGTSLMATLWEDLAKLHRILALLEREAAVLELVDDRSAETSVRLGSEIPAGEDDLAVVSAPYEAGGATGRMGVFGPMRMDYRHTIKVVEEVSDALEDTLGG
jgi:heat-inducible transcriptional repressor